MLKRIQHLLLSLLSLLFFLPPSITAATPIGICYGRVANNLPPPSKVVNLLKSNGISRLRLFDADPSTLKAFSGTGIELMIGVPNEILPSLATGTVNSSLEWLRSNILAHVPADQVRYIAVGNEIFLKDPFYTPYVTPAITNLYQALLGLNLANKIKLSSPLAASVLSSSDPPSSGTFDQYLRDAMNPLLRFLHDSRSALMVNVYPYISYAGDPKHVSIDFALFKSTDHVVKDGALAYNNLFDASVDAFVNAMEKEGFAGVPVVVTETGWPTAGGEGASPENAQAFNREVVKRALNDVGTPKRPGVGVEAYLFGVFDEIEKSGEEYERHFGIFGLNGIKSYDLNFM